MGEYLVKDIEDKFEKYLIEKNYNKNKAQLFKIYCGDAILFYGTMAIFKHYN